EKSLSAHQSVENNELGSDEETALSEAFYGNIALPFLNLNISPSQVS
ncbi:4478_t:CDS:1, partial [Racocetra fulgida]